jgi:hypothetical protein
MWPCEARETRFGIAQLTPYRGQRGVGFDHQRSQLPLREHGTFDTQMQSQKLDANGHRSESSEDEPGVLFQIAHPAEPTAPRLLKQP